MDDRILLDQEWIPYSDGESVPSCCLEDFYSALEVWLTRPNVVNKRVLAAVLLEDKEQWGESELASFAKINSCLSCGSSAAKVVVRELIPKSSKLTKTRELVVMGKSVTHHTLIMITAVW